MIYNKIKFLGDLEKKEDIEFKKIINKVKKMDKVIAFNSYNENFILSNMYPCKINYKGKLFYGVDHLYYCLLYYQHKDIQSKIEKCSGICANFNAKKIGDSNTALINEITDSQKINLIKNCIRLKYEQNKHCLDYLLDTEDAVLIEHAFWGDTFWGCVLKDERYEGENHTGKLLMEIREELRDKIANINSDSNT